MQNFILFSLRVLFWRIQFPDVILSKARVVMAWVSKQYTVLCREESHRQLVQLMVWDVQWWWGRLQRQTSRNSSTTPKLQDTGQREPRVDPPTGFSALCESPRAAVQWIVSCTLIQILPVSGFSAGERAGSS